MKLKEAFRNNIEVELPGPKGAQGLKHNKKMFAMFWKGDLVLQFTLERVQTLIDEGIGLPYDPGTGKPMKNRVRIPYANNQYWIELTQESLAYTKS